MYKNIFKRFLDIILSFIAIILLSPILLLIAILIKTTSKGKVIFTQKRIGKDKTHFNILKFRTMYQDTPKDVPTHLLKDPDIMITKVGKVLRKYSLDELPQIFNIFTGEMSIVGPRPALWNQYDLIEQRDLYKANAVRPGLTGLAQVLGRDELEIPIKAKIDGDYVKNITFLNDFKIIFKTSFGVILAKGVKEGKDDNTK